MIGRWVPPVFSPVAPSVLVSGAMSALGVARVPVGEVTDVIKRVFAARDVVLTDSGTSALVLAFRLAMPRGGTVALPAYSCIDLIAAAQRAKVSVRLYDLDPATLSPDLASVHSVIGRGVDAILVAPLFGYPADVIGVSRIAREHGAMVIEDAAQGAGATLEGKRLGQLGDVSVLSFGRGKGTTGGSGGALMVHRESLSAGAHEMSAQFAAPQRGVREVIALGAQWVLARPSVYALPSLIPALKLGEMVYHAAHEPRSMSRAATRIVAWALAEDSAEVARRQQRAQRLLTAAQRARRFTMVHSIPRGVAGYLRLAVLDATGVRSIAPRLGAVRMYPVTLDEHAESAGVIVPGESSGAGARTLRDALITLPTHSRMSAADEQRLAAWLGAEVRVDSAPPTMQGT